MSDTTIQLVRDDPGCYYAELSRPDSRARAEVRQSGSLVDFTWSEPLVNWPAIGNTTPEDAAVFSQLISEAVELAETLKARVGEKYR